MTTDTTARVSGTITDDMVERATMILLGHDKDHAPGIDWHCDRAWTVNTVRAKMRDALAAIHPDPEPGATENYAGPVSSAGTEPQPVRWQRYNETHDVWLEVDEHDLDHYRRKGQQIRPLYATPSSAGMVSVEAAEVIRCAELHEGYAASRKDRIRGPAAMSEREHLETARLLRALAGERG